MGLFIYTWPDGVLYVYIRLLQEPTVRKNGIAVHVMNMYYCYHNTMLYDCKLVM